MPVHIVQGTEGGKHKVVPATGMCEDKTYSLRQNALFCRNLLACQWTVIGILFSHSNTNHTMTTTT